MRREQTILLDTTKYDGSLHYRFRTEVVYRDERTLGVYRGPDRLLESHRGSFVARGHALNLFFSDTYHNIAVMWEADWRPRMHYVNIATPAIWNAGRVTSSDMDLDLIRFAGEERVILDDEEEFQEHTVTMAYPSRIVQTCLAEVDRLTPAMASGAGVFSDAIYDWRPGVDLREFDISV